MISTKKTQQDKSIENKLVRLQKTRNLKQAKTVNHHKTKYRAPTKNRVIVQT